MIYHQESGWWLRNPPETCLKLTTRSIETTAHSSPAAYAMAYSCSKAFAEPPGQQWMRKHYSLETDMS